MKKIRLPKDWEFIENAQDCMSLGKSLFECVEDNPDAELEREVSPSHPLFGIDMRAVSFWKGSYKDFLFKAENYDFSYVVVHFNWVGDPHAIGFKSYEDFYFYVNNSFLGKANHLFASERYKSCYHDIY